MTAPTPELNQRTCQIKLGKLGCTLFNFIKLTNLEGPRLLKWALLIQQIVNPGMASHVLSTDVSKWKRLAIQGGVAESLTKEFGLEFVVGNFGFRFKEGQKKLILVFERVSETLTVCVTNNDPITKDQILFVVLQAEKAVVEKLVGNAVGNDKQTKIPEHVKALIALDKILWLLDQYDRNVLRKIYKDLDTGEPCEIKWGGRNREFHNSEWIHTKAQNTAFMSEYDIRESVSLESFDTDCRDIALRFNTAAQAERALVEEKIAQAEAKKAKVEEETKKEYKPRFIVKYPTIWNGRPQLPSIYLFFN